MYLPDNTYTHGNGTFNFCVLQGWYLKYIVYTYKWLMNDIDMYMYICIYTHGNGTLNFCVLQAWYLKYIQVAHE